MDQPLLLCAKTGQYSSLHLDLGGLLFIPNLADGILCCLWQATSLLFPFLQNGDNSAEGLWKTVESYNENDRTAEVYGCWLLLLTCTNFVSGNLGA